MVTSRLFGSTLAGQTGLASTQASANNDLLTSDTLNSKTLNKEDFLKLLLTQLQNQDPLSPLDNVEFVSQLSQFSQLEQMLNINQNIKDLTTAQNSIRNSLLATFLGKTVKAEIENSEIYFNHEDGVKLNFELMDEADKVEINIYNMDGEKVKKIENLNQNGGIHEIYWDGTDDEGQKVSAGRYVVEITAFSGDESTWVQPYLLGEIGGIIFSNEEGPMVQVANQKVPISKILQVIDQPGQPTTGEES